MYLVERVKFQVKVLNVLKAKFKSVAWDTSSRLGINETDFNNVVVLEIILLS